MQCVNNLKQLGLAIHNHHNVHFKLPVNSVIQKIGSYYHRYDTVQSQYGRLGMVTSLLPYMDQQNLWEACMTSRSSNAGDVNPDSGLAPLSTATGNFYTAPAPYANYNDDSRDQPWHKQIPGLACPSDGWAKPGMGNSIWTNTDNRNGRNSYMASSGDWPDADWYYVRNGTEATQMTNLSNFVKNQRGPFFGLVFKSMGRDLSPWTFSEQAREFGAISDGTSNTIAMAEKCVGNIAGTPLAGTQAAYTANGPTPGWTAASPRDGLLVKRAVAISQTTAVAGQTVSPTTAGVPSRCFGTFVAGSPGGTKYSVAAQGEVAGVRWNCGLPAYGQFSTILPPNSPSCSVDGGQARLLSSASSNHTGGVNALKLDGSVNFIADNINVNSNESGAGLTTTSTGLDRFAVATGVSPYGVWGAMGSINGGETRVIP
ncbi:MAG: DUF1559 domain-containing protein [Planctomycetaceae bacterium]|nr:DUF1559 domain-containing protein [Planctomycetaceae bacterium]